MRRMFSAMLLGVIAIGTTVWAQQDEPPPATAPASPSNAADKPATSGTQPATSPVPASRSLPDRFNTNNPPRYSNRAPGGIPPAQEGQPAGGLGFQTPHYNQFGPSNGWPNAPQNNPVYRDALGYPMGPYYPSRIPSREDTEKAAEFGRMIEAMRKAKTEEERSEIRTKLSDLVSEQLDSDLAEREKRLAEIEARAKELREQLQQRKQSKAEIQKLIMMLIENPQGGLGLPSSFMNMINQPSYIPGSVYSAYPGP